MCTAERLTHATQTKGQEMESTVFRESHILRFGSWVKKLSVLRALSIALFLPVMPISRSVQSSALRLSTTAPLDHINLGFVKAAAKACRQNLLQSIANP